MGIQLSSQPDWFPDEEAEAVRDPAAEAFLCAPVYSQKDVAALVARAGFRAFREHAIPLSLYSSGQRAACLKYFCGFITVRQGPDEPYRHLSEISEWERVILAIHDFRHEYLLPSPSNDALITAARSRLRRALNSWISDVPRLKHRLTVGTIPKMGLVTIESHQINGRPDIEALEQFVVQYLEQGQLTRDITSSFVGEEPYADLTVKESPSSLHKHVVEPILGRWTSADSTGSRTRRH